VARRTNLIAAAAALTAAAASLVGAPQLAGAAEPTSVVAPITTLPRDVGATFYYSTVRDAASPTAGGPGSTAGNLALQAACGAGGTVSDPQWYALPAADLGPVRVFRKGDTHHSPGYTSLQFAYVNADTLAVLTCDGANRSWTTTAGVPVQLVAYTLDHRPQCTWEDESWCATSDPGYDLRQVAASVPANDRWQDATAITSLPFVDTVDTSNATPDFAAYDFTDCYYPADGWRASDVWWRYTPTTTGPISIKAGSARGSWPHVVVYKLTDTGPTPIPPALHDCDDEHLTAPLVAGVTYLVNVQHISDVWEPPAVGGPVTLAVGDPDALLPPSYGAVVLDPVAKTARIGWQAPPLPGVGAPITGYRVARNGTDTSGVGAWSTTVDATTRSFTFANLVAWQPYTFTVQALRGDVNGPRREILGVLAAAQPGVPRSVSATRGDARATVSWAPPANVGASVVSGYRVRRYAATGSTVQRTVTVAATARTYAFTGLTNGTGYRFDVTAINASGNGAVSPKTLVTTPVAAVRPSVPTSVTLARDEIAKTATLAWAPPTTSGSSPITGYVVTRSGVDSSGSGPLTRSLGVSARSLLLTGLVPGTRYVLTVAAVSAVGTGAAASTSVTLTTPGVPRSVTAAAGPTLATVTWLPPTAVGTGPVTGYRIRRYAGSSTTLQENLTVAATTRSYTFTGLRNGSTYSFDVTAINATGRGPASPRTPVVTPNP
jgi:hypothetical protein